MYYHELVVTLQLKQSITNDEMYEFLSNTINRAMLYDKELKETHEKNEYKFYTFSGLNPIEKDKIYQKDRIYIFNIRSINKVFLVKLKRVLPLVKENVNIMAMQIKTYSQKWITSLENLSPAVATIRENKYWRKENGLNAIINQACKNTIRKYNQYFQEQIPEDTIFIQSIAQTNKVPIKIFYKQGTLLGNKFIMEIKTDDLSQKLAFFMKATGMLEKNSIRSRILSK